jgi:hypothetical protein
MNEDRFPNGAARLYGRFSVAATSQLTDEKSRFEAALRRLRGVASFWRGFCRSSDRTDIAAGVQVNATPEARKARVQALVDALFETPRPEEYRVRFW